MFEEYSEEPAMENFMVDMARDYLSTDSTGWNLDEQLDTSRHGKRPEDVSFELSKDAPESLLAALEQEVRPSLGEQNMYDTYTLLDLPDASADSSGIVENGEDDVNAVISLRPQTRLFMRSASFEGNDSASNFQNSTVRSAANLSPLERKAASLSPTLIAEMPSTPDMRAMDQGLRRQIPQDLEQ